jgi:hypothetical protein
VYSLGSRIQFLDVYKWLAILHSKPCIAAHFVCSSSSRCHVIVTIHPRYRLLSVKGLLLCSPSHLALFRFLFTHTFVLKYCVVDIILASLPSSFLYLFAHYIVLLTITMKPRHLRTKQAARGSVRSEFEIADSANSVSICLRVKGLSSPLPSRFSIH